METSSRYIPEIDPSLEHVQAELARLDLLIQREVRRWQLAGQDPSDTFRGLYVSDDEASALLARSFASNWGQVVELGPEELRLFNEVEQRAAEQIRLLVERAQSQGQRLRLAELARSFGLDRFELDTLLICLAPSLDLRYERLYGYLQDDVTRKRPTINLALNLLGPVGSKRLLLLAHFAPEGPLFHYHLLERSAEPGLPLLGQTLTLDETIVAWLLGKYQPSHEIAACARLARPQLHEMDEAAALLPPGLDLADGPLAGGSNGAAAVDGRSGACQPVRCVSGAFAQAGAARCPPYRRDCLPVGVGCLSGRRRCAGARYLERIVCPS
jgi:hypothetical protein